MKVGHTRAQHCNSCSSQKPKPTLTTPLHILLKTISLSAPFPSLQKTQTTVSEGSQLSLNMCTRSRAGEGASTVQSLFATMGIYHLLCALWCLQQTKDSQPFQRYFRRQKWGKTPNPAAEAVSLTPLFFARSMWNGRVAPAVISTSPGCTDDPTSNIVWPAARPLAQTVF